MKHWIVLGDTRVNCRTWDQVYATCYLYNLTIKNEFAPTKYRCGHPLCPHAGETSTDPNNFCNPVEIEDA